MRHLWVLDALLLPGHSSEWCPVGMDLEHADIARLNGAGVGRNFYVVGNAGEITSSA